MSIRRIPTPFMSLVGRSQPSFQTGHLIQLGGAFYDLRDAFR